MPKWWLSQLQTQQSQIKEEHLEDELADQELLQQKAQRHHAQGLNEQELRKSLGEELACGLCCVLLVRHPLGNCREKLWQFLSSAMAEVSQEADPFEERTEARLYV